MPTLTTKNHYGRWETRTTEMISDTLELNIFTAKLSKESPLRTIVSVGTKDGMVTKFEPGLDYYSVWVTSSPLRLTSKVVEDQHFSMDFSVIRRTALEHYGIV